MRVIAVPSSSIFDFKYRIPRTRVATKKSIVEQIAFRASLEPIVISTRPLISLASVHCIARNIAPSSHVVGDVLFATLCREVTFSSGITNAAAARPPFPTVPSVKTFRIAWFVSVRFSIE